MASMLRVDVDLNSRTWDGLVRAGFEDVSSPVGVGQAVLAWQSDDEIVADAVVEIVDAERRLIYLRVKWDSLRDDKSYAFEWEVLSEPLFLAPSTASASPHFWSPNIRIYDQIEALASQ